MLGLFKITALFKYHYFRIFPLKMWQCKHLLRPPLACTLAGHIFYLEFDRNVFTFQATQYLPPRTEPAASWRV